MFQKPSRRGGRCDARHISSCRNHFCIFLPHDLTQYRHRVAFFSTQTSRRNMTENLETDVSHQIDVSTFETSYRTAIALRRHEKRKQLLPKRHSKTHMMHRVVGPVVVAFCIFEILHSLRGKCTLIRNNNCCQREPVLPKASRLLDRS